MMRMIAERWADRFSILNLLTATSMLLFVLLLCFALPRTRNSPSLRVFLSFPGLLYLWWILAFVGSGSEFGSHNPPIPFLPRLAIDLATFAAGMFVIVRLDVYLDRRKKTKDKRTRPGE
ncbi:MAG TPA: hypothetical protein VGM51_09200 [Armatimonadota bacterium]|jgi:hypothetical protein